MFSKRADQINYARVEGIEHKELPAAIIFAAIYVPLLCLCIFYSMRSTYVYKSLTLFCLSKFLCIFRPFHATHDDAYAVRIVAFVMRAVLAASATAGNNINLVVAQMVIYNIGFSGLLYSAYGLVLDRCVHPGSVHNKGSRQLADIPWWLLPKEKELGYSAPSRALFAIACYSAQQSPLLSFWELLVVYVFKFHLILSFRGLMDSTGLSGQSRQP